MAVAVERALESERHLFVDAGTGTGKTRAYLVPAVLSGRKVVVSTATKALQDQIYEKDIPLVARALAAHGVRFRAALMKGLANYVCLRRLEEARTGGVHGHDRDFARILDWLDETKTGDRSELADLPEDAPAWREVSSSSDTRIGADCAHFERCFVTRMRREAEEAQIVVVNHHLFLADLALRAGPRGAHASVLPAYDTVVFDEAHQIEDVATDFFGSRVSSARVEALLRDAERALGAANALEALTSGPVRTTLAGARDARRGRSLRRSSTAIAHRVPTDAKRTLAAGDVGPAVREAWAALDACGSPRSRGGCPRAWGGVAPGGCTEGRRGSARRPPGHSQWRALPRRTARSATSSSGSTMRARSVSLGASPVDVRLPRCGRGCSTACLRWSARAPPSQSRLRSRVRARPGESAVRGFSFAKARLGAPPGDPGARRRVSLSTSASRAALYLPDDLPEPSDPRFDDAATARIGELVEMTGGGAFVLCTSVRAMRSLHGRLRARLALPLLLQGERPKHLLLSRFRDSGEAVLVATMSFWEGVDVPGWALRLVILDKIPFAPPNDPVVAARCARLDREGGNGFTQYSVPSAAMTLKQGFGRLIRTQPLMPESSPS